MRSVTLFLALQGMDMGFVTIGRTPTPEQKAAFAVRGLFLPYRRDPQTGEITHWVARAHTLLRDRVRGVSFEAKVTLQLDCRSSLRGRLIPILHSLAGQDTSVELSVRTYAGRWEAQERVFRDSPQASQNLDAHYGQKKVAVPNRVQERKRENLRGKLKAQDKQVATAQRKLVEQTERLVLLQQEAQHKQEEAYEKEDLLRRGSQEATAPDERQLLWWQAEQVQARQQVEQACFRERQYRRQVQRRTWLA